MQQSVLNSAYPPILFPGNTIIVPVPEFMYDVDGLALRYAHYGVTRDTIINHALLLISYCFHYGYWESNPVYTWYFEDIVVGELLTTINFSKLTETSKPAISKIARHAGREISTVSQAIYAALAPIFKPYIQAGEPCYIQLNLHKWLGNDIAVSVTMKRS